MKIGKMKSKKIVVDCLLVLADLKTKLKLFMDIPMPETPTRLEKLKEITKDNIICDFLETYLLSPETIAHIPLEVFDFNKDLQNNLPIVLNDLRDFLLDRQEQILDACAGELKGAVVALQTVHTQFKTDFISMNWVKMSKKQKELPNIIEEFKPQSIQKYFSLTRQNRLLDEISHIEDTKYKLNRVSDYWKMRAHLTTEFLGELHKPLPHGKFGTRFIQPKIKKMVEENTYEKIPYIRPIMQR